MGTTSRLELCEGLGGTGKLAPVVGVRGCGCVGVGEGVTAAACACDGCGAGVKSVEASWRSICRRGLEGVDRGTTKTGWLAEGANYGPPTSMPRQPDDQLKIHSMYRTQSPTSDHRLLHSC